MKTGDHQSDEDLLCRAANGERQAFDEIVQRHKVTIYAFVRRYIGDSDDAYDVLQDTFVATWLSVGKFDLKRPFLPWLRTIALNKCRDFARRAAVRRLLLLAKHSEPAEIVPSPGETNDEDSRLKRLDKAILALSPLYREALLLTTVSGLSQAEAAEILKTTAKAVEMRIRRARKQLAAQLGEPDREG